MSFSVERVRFYKMDILFAIINKHDHKKYKSDFSRYKNCIPIERDGVLIVNKNPIKYVKNGNKHITKRRRNGRFYESTDLY
jgi:hypothetical protein